MVKVNGEFFKLFTLPRAVDLLKNKFGMKRQYFTAFSFFL